MDSTRFSCYGLSKVVGEEYCQIYAIQYGLVMTIVRFANVYGSRCHGVINDSSTSLLESGEAGKSLELDNNSGLRQRRRHRKPQSSRSLKGNSIGQTYNIGFGKTIKIIDLADMILRILGLSGKTVVTTPEFHGRAT